VTVTVLFVMPFLLLWGMWTEPSALTPEFFVLGAVFVLLVLVGRWDITSYHSQMALLVAFLLICQRKGGPMASLGAITLVLLLRAWLSRAPTKPIIELSFPLRNGWYYVAHGGARRIVNYHAPNKPQRFALDIVRLNSPGFRARGLYPSRLRSYTIFHDVLHSPCNGSVTAVVNDLPDLPPSEMDPEHVAGNHIVIECTDGDTFIGLAHLARGSICVNAGDVVAAGQRLAQIGNSGNTSEPHLHIHAKRRGRPDSMLDGEGVAIRFGGRWLTRNSVVTRRLRRANPTDS
jgi:hypothetical protein